MDKTDFFTIAMHEIGHVIGLNHINDGVADRLMRTDIVSQAQAAGTTGVRAPDIGSIFGAEALYIQPVPEPSSFALSLFAMMGLLRFRRTRQR